MYLSNHHCLLLLNPSISGNSSVELAVTGSGLPVSLVPSPSHKFDFPACVVGQHAELLCVLRNLCTQIPVKFHFRKLAQFTTNPVKGTIAPGQCQVTGWMWLGCCIVISGFVCALLCWCFVCFPLLPRPGCRFNFHRPPVRELPGVSDTWCFGSSSPE